MASVGSWVRDGKVRITLAVALAATLGAAAGVAAAAGTDVGGEEAGPFGHLEWRAIGPVNMSGRVADVEGVPGDPNVVYVGSASGGVWKTEDGGLTFQPIFDDQPIASIGDLALAPSNPSVVYVGSGESAVRNSVSYGNGVYRSTDGGQSWTHLGLEKTETISRVLVHPTDPDTVWVGALGSIWGPSEERGVFRSTDGGASWQRVLYLDDRHGVADLELEPGNPKVLYAALWHFERKPWTHRSGSEEGGVWKSVDGGATWSKLGEGLPKLMGRIGVRVAPSNPKVVYVIAESKEGTLFRSDDRGATFTKVSDDVEIVSRGFYYTRMAVDPTDENRLYAIASRLFVSIDGGKSFERISRETHVDYHSLWIDPLNPRRLWQGQDGGVAVSYDRGRSWEPIRNLPLGQFYQVYADDREPFYYVGGGLQDNGTWYGPSRTREPAGILEDDWRMVSFGDAYFVVPHPDDPELLISESQAGGIVRTDMRTRQQIDISPQPRRNDGGPVGELTYRFNWNAPIVASPHEPETVYFAANVVFRSRDFGDSWEAISPDLTTDDPDKQGVAGGPAWTENTTAEYHCTIISFAESLAEAGVLWAGTDDGNLQLSRDGGGSWTNVVGNVPGLPPFSPVSHLEPSRTAAGTAYAAFDRHMFGDFRPHLFKTTDFGQSWRRISGDLPAGGWLWVVREDPRNPELLYAGTELGLYASWDGGRRWQRLHLKNLPTVAVHDLLVHPRANDLILGTHGRAIWIFDDARPIQRFGDVAAGAPAHLFAPRPALRFPSRFTRYGLGDKVHKAPNPPAGALITYFLREKIEPPEEEPGAGTPAAGEAGRAAEEAPPDAEAPAAEAGGEEDREAAGEERLTIEILDAAGEVVRRLEELPAEAGLNRVAWDLAYDPPRPRKDEKEREEDFWRVPKGPAALPGTYTVRLTLDGTPWEQPMEVRIDPTVATTGDDLERLFAAGLRLRDLRSAVNDGLRGLDALAAQREAWRAALKALKREVPAEVEAAIQAHEEEAAALVDLLARPEEDPFWSQGPRLAERLGGLASDLEGGFRAPTAAQEDYFRELEAEAAAAFERLNRFFSQGVGELNARLAEHRLPPLLAPEPVAAGDGG